jgi:uncharacterized protein YbjT (DUF2867 family)
MITVMGATGQTGGAIARLLLESGEEVRAVGRSATRLGDLAGAGAETRDGDVSDPAFLAEAFRGADAVYSLLPIDPSVPGYRAQQDRLGEAIVAAVRDARVPHLVALSAVGADVPSGTGFLEGLYAQEQRLRRLDGTSVLILRPGSFFENFHAALDVIRHEGVLADSVAPDVPVPMVAVGDIARVAAAALAARDWPGVEVREVLGPRDLSHAEVAFIIGAEIGHPGLDYVQLPDDVMVGVLVEAGLAEDAARLQIELTRAISDGVVVARGEGTVRTPTRFEDFAKELAAAYQAA